MPDPARSRPNPDRLLHAPDNLDAFLEELDRVGGLLPSHIGIDPESAEKGLAQLVLTLVEVVRELMERQAVRRMESGSLTPEEIDRLGETFANLKERMEELKEVFELEDEDLNLDLGPLGGLR